MNFDIKEQSVEEALQRVRGVIRDMMSDKKNSKETDGDVLELSEAEIVVDHSSEQPEASIKSESKPIDVLQAIDDVIFETDEEAIQEEIKDSIAQMKIAKKSLPDNEDLISTESAKLSQDSIRTLRKTLGKSPTESAPLKNNVTMEELVIASMKPYLKEWLDKNLPQIVKSLVEKEIKKLIPED